MSISESIKIRLAKDRAMTSITLCISVDVFESMKDIAASAVLPVAKRLSSLM